MSLASIIGLILGIVSVAGAMYFKELGPGIFNNPAALFVIFVGTVACVMNAFTESELKNLGKLFKIIFFKSKTVTKVEVISIIEDLAQQARKEGILSLESKVDAIEDEFLKTGLGLIVDGSSEETIIDVLSTQMEEMQERHALNASIFSQAGAYAPTLGVLGAVFGLIAAMSHIDDVGGMAHAISAAFVATILGIFTGYVLWNPFANKLKVKSKQEMIVRRMMIEGLVSIQKGDPTAVIKNKLVSFLSDTERKSVMTAKDED